MPDSPSTVATRRARPLVLHVDDNDANRYAVSRVLTHAGFDVIEGRTGREALEKARERPDLIVLDVRLPDVSGVEVCRAIKADPATATVPVLHLSASYTTSDHKAEGLDAGADGYLVRPVEPVELVATVKALLRQRRMEDALRASEERYRLLLERERAARAEAEQANRLKDEFLATLSHELRTPLNAIVGWAMILRRTRDVDPNLADGLATIERNAKVQAQLIDDLLDVSRIISGKLRLEVEIVDLTSIIESAVASVHPAAEARQITIRRVLSSRQSMVSGDAARLQQVVWNLLTNAIKFTPRGGQVTVTLGRIQSYVEIVVTDTGKGIDPEFLPHVFDRFRQADPSTTRAHGGLGLGLAIVRHLTELHGGSVRAESDGVDRGARFTITLPVTATQPRSASRGLGSGGVALAPERQSADEGSAPSPVRAQAVQPELVGVRVLVVDDQEDSRRLLSHILLDSSAAVETAGSAQEAMEQLRRRRFDVIVSDVGMPGHDGYELMRWVRALPDESGGRTPALALTAFARSEDRRHALLAGFQNHLAKPVDPFELLAAVASAAGRTGRVAVDSAGTSE